MATTFADFMAGLKREAKAEGPEAVAELKYFRARFRLARRFAEARLKRGWTQKKLADKTGLNQSEISTLRERPGKPNLQDSSDTCRRARGQDRPRNGLMDGPR